MSGGQKGAHAILLHFVFSLYNAIIIVLIKNIISVNLISKIERKSFIFPVCLCFFSSHMLLHFLLKVWETFSCLGWPEFEFDNKVIFSRGHISRRRTVSYITHTLHNNRRRKTMCLQNTHTFKSQQQQSFIHSKTTQKYKNILWIGY